MKKLLAIFLATLMTLGLVGCAPPAPPHDDGSRDDGPPVFEGEEGKGEEGKGEEEEKGEEGKGETTGGELPDADMLAFSHNRLENADLSFNFTIAGETPVRARRPLRASDKDKGDYEPYVPTEDDEFHGTPDTLKTYYQDFFESCRSYIDTARIQSDRIRNTVLEQVNVMDKFVHGGVDNYLLSYIPETDTLHVYCVSDTTDGHETYDILIHPDAEGDETVEFWYVNTDERPTHNNNLIQRVIYTAEKRYYVENILVYPDPALDGQRRYSGFIFEIYCKDGEWRGYELWDVDTSAPFCSHSGSYSNGWGSYFIFYKLSDDGIMLSTTSGVSAYDGITGEEKESEDDYAETDVFRFDTSSIEYGSFRLIPEWLYANYPQDLEGWESVDLNFQDVSHDGLSMYHVYTLHLSDGRTLKPDNCLWKRGYGLIEFRHLTQEERDEVNMPKDENDSFHDYSYYGTYGDGEGAYFTSDDFTTDVVRVRLDHAGYEPGKPINSLQILFMPYWGTSSYNAAYNIELIRECWDDLGFGVRPGCSTPADLFDAFLATDPQAVAEEIMLDVYNQALGLDGIREFCFKTCGECDEVIARMNSLFDEYEMIEWEEMPTRPDNFGLIQLGGKLSGQATVSEEGIDYSAVTFEGSKTVIFSKDSQYALYVAWGSYAERITEPVTYAGEAFTLTGKVLPLPDLPVGTYTAKLFFGKVLEGGCARLSDAVSVPVSAFEKVTIAGGEEKGLRKMSGFAHADGITAEVALVDVLPPEISVDGEAAGTEPIVLDYAFEEGKTVSDLFDMISVTDNSVGIMSARSGQISLDGVVMFATDVLKTGTYVFTVADSSGNQSTVTFQVTVAEPVEPSEGPDGGGESEFPEEEIPQENA